MLMLGLGLSFISMVKSVGRTSLNHLRLSQIAKYHTSYTIRGEKFRKLQANDIYEVAEFLAKYTKLTDAAIWRLDGDPAVTLYEGKLPRLVTDPNFRGSPISVTLVVDNIMPLDAPTSTTPLLWTRGLQPDGSWSETAPLGTTGGHIVFMDGHGEYFESGDVRLTKYGTNEPTQNIYEAIPPDAIVLEYQPDYDLSDEETIKRFQRERKWQKFMQDLPVFIFFTLWFISIVFLPKFAIKLWKRATSLAGKTVSIMLFLLALFLLGVIAIPAIASLS